MPAKGVTAALSVGKSIIPGGGPSLKLEKVLFLGTPKEEKSLEEPMVFDRLRLGRWT